MRGELVSKYVLNDVNLSDAEKFDVKSVDDVFSVAQNLTSAQQHDCDSVDLTTFNSFEDIVFDDHGVFKVSGGAIQNELQQDNSTLTKMAFVTKIPYDTLLSLSQMPSAAFEYVLSSMSQRLWSFRESGNIVDLKIIIEELLTTVHKTGGVCVERNFAPFELFSSRLRRVRDAATGVTGGLIEFVIPVPVIGKLVAETAKGFAKEKIDTQIEKMKNAEAESERENLLSYFSKRRENANM